MNEQKIKHTFDISTQALIKITVFSVGLLFVLKISDIITIFLFAIVLTAVVNQAAKALKKYKIPHVPAVIGVFIFMLLIFIGGFWLALPILLEQINELSTRFPSILNSITEMIPLSTVSISTETMNSLGQTLTSGLNGAFGKIYDFFNGLSSLVLLFVLTFYMSIKQDTIKKVTTLLLPEKYHAEILSVIDAVQKKAGAWVAGQLLLSVIIGITAYIGLTILDVRYALILALIAAIGEIVPYVGPSIGGLFAVIVALSQDPIKAIFIGIWYVAMQQLENHLLVPKVMEKAVGLDPIVSILALLIGFRVGGVVGLMLAIPSTTILIVIVKHLYNRK